MAPRAAKSSRPPLRVSSALRGSERAGYRDLDRGHVAPELLEPVVPARLGGEDVQDHVEVVDEDPPRLLGSGDASREQAVLVLHALVHLVVDRLRLARVPAGADDEVVRVRADGPHVEDDDVCCELLLGELGDLAGLLERRQRPGISSFTFSQPSDPRRRRSTSIQPQVDDQPRDRRRHEAVDRLAAGQAGSDLS
jgi:hypothetical protein